MKKSIYIAVLSAGLWMFASCGNQLDLEPENAITQEQIEEILRSGDDTKIDQILGGLVSGIPLWIHRPLGGSDSRINSLLNLNYINNLQGYDIVPGKDAYSFGYDAYRWNGKNARGSTSEKNVYYWNFGWKAVTEANRLLSMLKDDIVGENKKMKGYKASALTLRAFAYNFLMENYREAYRADGVGLMIYDETSTDYKPFSTAGEVYDFIKEDLTKAVKLFSESELGEKKDGYTADTKDLDLAVANFVRARVCLLTGDYDTAIRACESVLNKYPTLIATANYGGKNTGTAEKPVMNGKDNAFVNFESNPEVILGFTDVNNSTNYAANWMNCFGLGYGGETGEYARIVNTLYDQIADTDVRKAAFLASEVVDYEYPNSIAPTYRTIPEYSNVKFAATHGKDGKKVSTSLARFDVCYMRSSEVLLMKAEAEALSGKEAAAKSTLNQLLEARSTTETLTVDDYGTASSILDMVKLQWRIEMWGENGLEYYNNKRWGVNVQRAAAPQDIHRNKMTIMVDQMTLDIPDNEIMYNPNL